MQPKTADNFFYLGRAIAAGFLLIFLGLVRTPPEPAAPTAPPSIPTPPTARVAPLQARTDALLPLFEKMPPVPVFVRDEPILKSGTDSERGVAYTHCDKDENPSIFVKTAFFENANQKQLTNILKHELTHAWLCRQNLMAGHDERFRKKFAAVGGFGN